MLRSLDQFLALLGVPAYRSVLGGSREGTRASAHWACGCAASGSSFEKLMLKTCSSHRAGRLEAPPLAV